MKDRPIPVKNRAEKPTKCGAQCGSFRPCRGIPDASKPLKPGEMRERYADVTEYLAQRRKRRRRLAKKGRVV